MAASMVLVSRVRYEALEELVVNNLQALQHNTDDDAEREVLKKYEVLITTHRATPEDWLEAIELIKM